MSTEAFIFSVLILINALMALAMLLAARTLGQPRIAFFLAGAFGSNVLLYVADGVYFFLFRGNLAFNLALSAIAMMAPILAAIAYRLRSGLPLHIARFAVTHGAAMLVMLWFSVGAPDRGYREAVVPIYAAAVLLYGVTALWRPGRRLRLGERPIIVTSFAMAAIEFAGGLVLAAMGNQHAPDLEQTYKLIVFLGLPAMTVAAGIFSLYLLAGDLAERLRDAADTDPLTGAPNRRAIESTGVRMMAEARAAGQPLTVALCDVDHFKEINDLHGHERGDEVLCRLSGLFRQHLGAQDYHGRFGGEEFILFFPYCDLDTAHRRIEGLRREIMALRVGESPAPFTASFGIATMTDHDHFLADIVKRADRALYASKEAGRNRTTVDHAREAAVA